MLITINFTRPQIDRLRQELERAGNMEIGGVLVGEHVTENRFDIIDFSVQSSGGTEASFRREPSFHNDFLNAFYCQVGDRRRYNYLGEWHSHPSGPDVCSATDEEAMRAIFSAPRQRANFAVLLIVRLAGKGLSASATLHRRAELAIPVEILLDGTDIRNADGILHRIDLWLRRFLE